jgi:hypothetical protein
VKSWSVQDRVLAGEVPDYVPIDLYRDGIRIMRILWLWNENRDDAVSDAIAN